MSEHMRIHFEEFGDADLQTVIFVHGAGGSSVTWFMQLRRLSDSLHVVALDLNGHGKTAYRESSDVLGSYLEDVDEVVGLFQNPILGGHSMGGALTQLYALQNPAKIAGIILVSTGSRLKVHPSIFDMLQNNFDAYVDAAANFMFDESTPENVISASQAEIRKCPPNIISRDFEVCNSFDIMDTVASIKLPTLIIVGENDLMTPVKYSQYINERIEDSEIMIIPQAGHSVMLEQYEKVNEAIVTWIHRKF